MNRTSGCPVLKFQKMRIGWPHLGVLPETSKLLNKRRVLTRVVVELKFYIRVQKEGMGVEEEFVQGLWYLFQKTHKTLKHT